MYFLVVDFGKIGYNINYVEEFYQEIRLFKKYFK